MKVRYFSHYRRTFAFYTIFYPHFDIVPHGATSPEREIRAYQVSNQVRSALHLGS